MIDNIVVAGIAFTFSQVILSLLLLSRSKTWSVQERLYAALLLAITSYLLTPLMKNELFVALIQPLQTAVPGLFWLFSASLFDDHFKLRRWQISLVAITVLLPELGKLVVGYELFFKIMPQVLEFILVSLALFVVARYWREDLIESRRKLRLWFSGLNGTYIFLLLFFRVVVFPELTWMASLQYVASAGMLLATNAILLDYKSGILSLPEVSSLPAQGIESSSPLHSTDQESVSEYTDIIKPLNDMIEQQKIYREMGLTIGQLAEQLKVHEYRLRLAINKGLGYRNFNDFLNSYRIEEVSQRLSDPTEKAIPVLTIALDAGFRSLSSFNKAFKDKYDVPPTAYRRDKLA